MIDRHRPPSTNSKISIVFENGAKIVFMPNYDGPSAFVFISMK